MAASGWRVTEMQLYFRMLVREIIFNLGIMEKVLEYFWTGRVEVDK